VLALWRGEPPTIYGDGTQSRDFNNVANVVRANLLTCEGEEAVGEVMNVACGERYTLLDLSRELVELTGRTLKPKFAPPRAGDVEHSLAAIDRAKELLGYRPCVSRHAGRRETAARYKAGAAR